MDFYGPISYDAPEPPPGPLPTDEEQVLAAAENLERFLKGQGLLSAEGQLCVLNAAPEAAMTTLNVISRLVSIHQQDDYTREQLREQANKDRVTLTAAQRSNEALQENVRRLKLDVKDLEGKLLSAKHKAEEHERDLQRRLKSTEARVNELLRGSGRDAGKRSAAAGGGAAAAPSNARRAGALAYNRFEDDLEAELADRSRELVELQKQNARLKQQLAAAERQQQKGPGAGGRAAGGQSRAGRWNEQLAAAPAEQGFNGEDVQSVRDSTPDASALSPIRSPESLNQLARQQRIVRELEAEVQRLRSSNQDLHRQLDKANRERSDNVQMISALRTRCAGLEIQLRKADDLALLAQRNAAAAQLDPAAAEGQVAELRRQLAARQEELAEANSRAIEAQQRLAKAEATVEGNAKRIGILARAMMAQKDGEGVLKAIEEMVAQEVCPLQQKLEKAWSELATAQGQVTMLQAELGSVQAGAAPAVVHTAASAGAVASPSSYPEPSMETVLPLSPPGALPFSPVPRFQGFAAAENLTANSPPKLQPPPAHAFYNRSHASTMPSPHARSRAWSQPRDPSNASLQDQEPSQQRQDPPQVTTYGGAFPPPLPPGGGGHAVRRSMSAGVSAERRRWQLQSQVRHPSPIDVIMEQARDPDPSISIAEMPAGPVEGWAPPDPRSMSPGGGV